MSFAARRLNPAGPCVGLTGYLYERRHQFMMRQRRVPAVLLGLIVLAVLLAACGGGESSSDPQPPAATSEAPASDPAAAVAESEPPPVEAEQTLVEPEPPVADDPEVAEPESSETLGDAGVPDQLSFTLAAGWQTTFVDEGIKPDIALDASGTPGVAYMRKALDGWVRFASATDGWQVETVAECYFYGPIGLAFDPDAGPHVVWHDHQDSSFNLDKGDLAYGVHEDSAWVVEAAADAGHDGWDSTIAIGSGGVVRAAGVEPVQFGLENGVEYYERRDGTWVVQPSGSGPIPYEFNVSLALDGDGFPALTSFEAVDGDLVFASFDGSAWSMEIVASEGTVGMFSSLAFDAEGQPHISFFETAEATTGIIHYASRDADGGWTVEEIAELNDVELGMTGTRRNSAIAVDATGVPHVVLSDRSVLSYAVRGVDGWEVEELAQAGAAPLGQLVSFQLGADGTPHLSFFEVTSSGPLEGLVAYVTRGEVPSPAGVDYRSRLAPGESVESGLRASTVRSQRFEPRGHAARPMRDDSVG